LHHPFPVPEPYKTLLDSIKDPVRKSMKYTDLALQAFFDKIKNEDWYKNSIIAISADHTSGGFGYLDNNSVNEFVIPISFIAPGDTAFNKMQDQSISQIDMYPTVLDYLGYNKPFVALGNSALSKQHPAIQYMGNGVFVIFEYPYALEFDNNNQRVNRFFEYSMDRKATDLPLDDNNRPKVDRLTDLVKAYIQVFSYRVNKNQF